MKKARKPGLFHAFPRSSTMRDKGEPPNASLRGSFPSFAPFYVTSQRNTAQMKPKNPFTNFQRPEKKPASNRTVPIPVQTHTNMKSANAPAAKPKPASK